mmetsp:Transcript_15572/g.23329  ORF Transcript_15572/g.23329 Transcript_15572/m.23329 type:complete len:85 (+) Transcript_15572:326-580(+)
MSNEPSSSYGQSLAPTPYDRTGQKGKKKKKPPRSVEQKGKTHQEEGKFEIIVIEAIHRQYTCTIGAGIYTTTLKMSSLHKSSHF